MDPKATLTQSAPAHTFEPLRPGGSVVLKIRIVGTGTVAITDADGDTLEDLDAVAATITKTIDLANSKLTATASGADGTTAHVITCEEIPA